MERFSRLRIWRRNELTDEPAEVSTVETEADYPIETIEEDAEQNWLMLASLALATLAFAVLVVLAGRWAYNHSHNQAVKSPTIEKIASGKNPATVHNTNGSGGSSSSSSSASSGSQSGQGSKSTEPTNLPNNGPGDVAAIFIGSVIAATLLHVGYSARRVS